MDKIATQIGATSALQLLRDLLKGKLDLFELEEAAQTSKKKARKLRQVKFLILWIQEQGSESVIECLKEEEGQMIYLTEDGEIVIREKASTRFRSRKW